MSYKNKTFSIFDRDKDIWAYTYMQNWKNSEHIDFNFYDASALSPLAVRVRNLSVQGFERDFPVQNRCINR
jgi:hypothetical protein